MNKMKTLSVVLVAMLLITITLVAINSEKEKIQHEGPEKVYIGHNEKIVDNAYKDLIGSITKLEEETSDEAYKLKLTGILKSTEDDQVVLQNFNKDSAVKSLQELFLGIGKDLGQLQETKTVGEIVEVDENYEDDIETKKPEDKKYLENISKKLQLLDKNETDIEDVLDKDTIDRLYLSEDFKKDKFNRQFAASSLLIYYDIIASNDNTKIIPAIQIYDEIVYLDSRFMTAHIPLDLFIGSGTGIAFEMQYVDGEWKLNPYTSMMSLNLMSILNNTETK